MSFDTNTHVHFYVITFSKFVILSEYIVNHSGLTAHLNFSPIDPPIQMQNEMFDS